MAKELSRNPTVLIVNDTVFAHGGLLPEHINYGLQRINREVRRRAVSFKENCLLSRVFFFFFPPLFGGFAKAPASYLYS